MVWAQATAFALLLLSTPAQAESWLKRVLDFIGVTASPQVKDDPGTPITGPIFVVDLKTGKESQVTSSGGYQWPVFSVDGKSIHALTEGATVVTIPLAGGKVPRGPKVPTVRTLIGCHPKQPNEILVLLKDPNKPVGVLDLSTGAVRAHAYDPKDDEQVRMLARLESEERGMGNRRVFPCEQSQSDIAGTRTWTAVCVQDAGADPRIVGKCATRNCREPSLSLDGQRAVYIGDKR